MDDIKVSFSFLLSFQFEKVEQKPSVPLIINSSETHVPENGPTLVDKKKTFNRERSPLIAEYCAFFEPKRNISTNLADEVCYEARFRFLCHFDKSFNLL